MSTSIIPPMTPPRETITRQSTPRSLSQQPPPETPRPPATPSSLSQQPPPETPRPPATPRSMSQVLNTYPQETPPATTRKVKKERKTEQQKQKEKKESDEAYTRLYFTQYLEKGGLDQKLLNDERYNTMPII